MPLSLTDPISLVVVGAHLSGMPLNHELQSLEATLLAATRTEPLYRLFELPGTTPRKPGLLRVGPETGAALAVEVWQMSPAAFGTFVANIPAPLGIATLLLESGVTAKGFAVEEIATRGARDVTGFGGWRNYIASLVAA